MSKREDDWRRFRRECKPLISAAMRASVTKLVIPKLFRSLNRLPLGTQFRLVMMRQQNANMVSNVYSSSGLGLPPISGGKFELRRRDKLRQR